MRLTIKLAYTFIERLKGLMFEPSIPTGQGVLLTPCSRIHTCFMRFPIDVIYLSGDCRVLDIETINPWRVGKRVAGTKMVIETEAGYCVQLRTGSNLIFVSDPR